MDERGNRFDATAQCARAPGFKSRKRAPAARRLWLALGLAFGAIAGASAATAPYYLATGMQPVVPGVGQLVKAFNNQGIAYGNEANAFYDFTWSQGAGSQVIGTPGCSVADANDKGLVVGSCGNVGVAWTSSGMQPLFQGYLARAVNNQGWVVGSTGTFDNPSSVVWRPGFGVGPVAASFDAVDINNQGLIAGRFLGSAALGSLAADGTIVPTFVGLGGSGSSLAAINDRGQFVGDDGHGRSFIGSVGGSTQLLNLPYGYTQSFVWGVNNNGVVIGEVTDGSLWDGGGVYPPNQVRNNAVALWENGTVRVIDIRNLLTQYSSPYQKGFAVPDFTYLHINDSGQIALDGMVNGTDPFGYLLNPCQRCGQIHPNPNPDGNAISVGPDWEQATNGEDFANLGQIALTTYMDNTGTLATSGAGVIAIYGSGALVNKSRMSFADSSAAPYGFSLLVHSGGLFTVAAGGSVEHAGTTQIGQGGTVSIEGRWTAQAGAIAQVFSGGQLLVQGGGVFSNLEGAWLQVQSNGSANFYGNSKLINAGNITVDGGLLSSFGWLYNAAGGRIVVSGGVSGMGRMMTQNDGNNATTENHGFISIATGGEWELSGGAVRNYDGARVVTLDSGHLQIDRWSRMDFDAGSEGSFFGQPVTLGGRLASAGTVNFFSGIDGMGAGSELFNESHGVMRIDEATEIRGRFSMSGGSVTEVRGSNDNQLSNFGQIDVDGRETALWESPTGGTLWRYTGKTLPTTASFYSGIVNNMGAVVQVLNGASLKVGSLGFSNVGGHLYIDAASSVGATPNDGASFTQLDGELEVDGRMDLATFRCGGGTVAGSGRINTSGAFAVVDGCTISPGSGPVVNGAPLGPQRARLVGGASPLATRQMAATGSTVGSFEPGTLTLSGSVVFDNANFVMGVSHDGASQVVIEGSAQFNGGALHLSFLDGAMPDPDAPLDLFSIGRCGGCGWGTLAVDVQGADPNWTGRLGQTGAAGALSVQVENLAAIDLVLDTAPEQVIAAGTTVYNRAWAQIDAGQRLLNDGAFYNRLGATLTVRGEFANRSGGQTMNHDLIWNAGTFGNEVGGTVVNRGTIWNSVEPGALRPASLVNRGVFINDASGRIDNADQGIGQIVNESTGRFVNRGLITNAAAYSQLEPVGGAWLVNRGELENHGSIIGNPADLILNDGGLVIIHGTGVVQTGSYHQNAAPEGQAAAETVVNGLLQSSGDVLLASGTRLSGTGRVVGRVIGQGGVVAPGDPTGTLQIDGSLMYTDLDVLFNGAGSGKLSVSGTASVGTVQLRLANDFAAAAGSHFTWLTAGSALGLTADHVNFLMQSSAGDWTSVAMQTVAGQSFWTLTLPTGELFAVFDAGRTADGNASFGFDLVSSVTAVPEPRAAVLMLMGLAWLAVRRRRAA